MKTIIGLAAALALALSVVPATAGDMFQALSVIPASEQAGLTPLTDDQLAAVEGGNILELIHLLLAITPENAATLISQILRSLHNQLTIASTPTDRRNMKEVIQLNIGPTPNAQRNDVAVRQR
jgi:aminoglycoside phosphotransferase